ncbi:hypothetical protein ACNPN6_15265 [Enterobacter quasiroggenkampii]|uniref:hypothetical protein n=1 Tax=Enterobacter quasiroggenkampii TaxID=2497436 RepID=UPI003AAAC62E
MSTIQGKILNTTSNNYNVHVYDLFGGGYSEVANYSLAKGESGTFSANADFDGHARVAYKVDGGPSLSNIDIVNGDVIEI